MRFTKTALHFSILLIVALYERIKAVLEAM